MSASIWRSCSVSRSSGPPISKSTARIGRRSALDWPDACGRWALGATSGLRLPAIAQPLLLQVLLNLGVVDVEADDRDQHGDDACHGGLAVTVPAGDAAGRAEQRNADRHRGRDALRQPALQPD